jgi:hypothetical protein
MSLANDNQRYKINNGIKENLTFNFTDDDDIMKIFDKLREVNIDFCDLQG